MAYIWWEKNKVLVHLKIVMLIFRLLTDSNVTVDAYSRIDLE